MNLQANPNSNDVFDKSVNIAVALYLITIALTGIFNEIGVDNLTIQSLDSNEARSVIDGFFILLYSCLFLVSVQSILLFTAS